MKQTVTSFIEDRHDDGSTTITVVRDGKRTALSEMKKVNAANFLRLLCAEKADK